MSTSTQNVPPSTINGDTTRKISFRTVGSQTVELQSAGHGLQQLGNYHAGVGDVIGLDNILSGTLAHANLSDIGNWITSTVSGSDTILWFDPSGKGGQVTAIARLYGTQTTVAQLVANGGFSYAVNPIEVGAQYGSDFTFRPDGQETVDLVAMRPGDVAQVLNGFDPSKGDVIELQKVLDPTNAQVDLSNIANYVTATVVNGDTVLSVDTTGQGGAGTPFAILKGVSTSLGSLLAANAIEYSASPVMVVAAPGTNFTYRDVGMEQADVKWGSQYAGAVQLNNFSLAAGDKIGLRNFFGVNGVAPQLATVPKYFHTVTASGNTTLYFDKTGSGAPGVAVAVLHGTQISLAQLLAGNAIAVGSSDDPPGKVTLPDGSVMKMGCPGAAIAFRNAGNMTVCLAPAQAGEQVLKNFNPAIGDHIGLDDVLETTLAHANLSDVANYITSSVSNGSTTLYFDPTGHGHGTMPIALLQGVVTIVAQLAANGGINYVPDRVTLDAQLNVPFTFRPDGLETVVAQSLVPGQAAQVINGFDPGAGDQIELQNVLGTTNALPDLSNLSSYVSATVSNGNTVLSLDATGHGGAGTPFAVLEGVNVTLAQLVSNDAISFTPAHVNAEAGPKAEFTFRAAGLENAFIGGTAGGAVDHLAGFSLTAGDSLGLHDLFAGAGISGVTTATIGNYLSAVQSGGSTTLYFDQTGSGHGGGIAFATLDNTSVAMPDLLAAGALHI